jgi:hypothetical protein
LITTDQPVRSDYALMQVTLTLAVESYVCDDHAAQMHEAAIEEVLERFQILRIDDQMIGTEIVVLNSEFTPLTLSKQVQS